MAKTSRIVFTKSWDKLIKQLERATWEKTMLMHIERATNLNGHIGVARLKNVIKSGKFAANKQLTVFIKQSTKPLTDKGDLFNAVESKKINPYTVFVGILKENPSFDEAVIVHEGAFIDVTQKMRNMFYNLWLVAEGGMDPGDLKGRAAELWKRKKGRWLPLAKSTKKIKIPRRPFVEKAFKSDAFNKKVQNNWHRAIKSAFKDIKQGAGR